MNAPASLDLSDELAQARDLRAIEHMLRGYCQQFREKRIQNARARCKAKAERQYKRGDEQGFIESCHRIQRLNRMRSPQIVRAMDDDRLARLRARGL